MKTGLLLVALFIGQLVIAQPVIKLYGYSQQFTPGNIPADVPAENGEQKPPLSFVRTQYYIYVAAGQATDIAVSEVWIGGKWDTVSSQQQVASPVVIEYPEKKTLVAATAKKVLRIDAGDTLKRNTKPSATLQKMMKANELIIVYTWKGKKYYGTLRKLTVLPPFHGI